MSDNLDKFDLNGYLGIQGGGAFLNSTFGTSQGVVFVANCTELGITRTYGNFSVSVDGQAPVNFNSASFDDITVIATGLAPGHHLFRIVELPQYLGSIQLTGGSEQITSIAKKYAWLTDHIQSPERSVPFTIPDEVSPVAIQGAHKLNAPRSVTHNVGTYGSFLQQVAFSGTGLEVMCLLEGRPNALRLDEGPEQYIQLHGAGGGFGWSTIGAGVDRGAHTVSLLDLSGGNTSYLAMRVLNGPRTRAALAPGANSVTVEDASGLAVGHWVRLGRQTNKEYVQVAAINGNTVSFSPACAQAHAADEPFESYHAPQGSFAPWRSASYPLPAKRVVAMGDSNTHGANPYHGTPQNGKIYGDYDTRISALYHLTQALGWEGVNLGIQGTDTIGQANRRQDILDYAQGSLDYLLLMEGTNDINSNTTTPQEFKANVVLQIQTARLGLREGGRIILVPIQTPQNAISTKGLSVAIANQQMADIAADPAYASDVLYAANAWDGVNLTLYNASTNPGGELADVLHFMPSAHEKVAANLATVISGVAPADTTAPATPDGLTATPSYVGGLSQIDLSWSAVADADVAGYELDRAGTTIDTAQSGAVATSYSHAGVTPGTSYAYRVRAYDGAGNRSAWSPAQSAVAIGSAGTGTGDSWTPGEKADLIAEINAIKARVILLPTLAEMNEGLEIGSQVDIQFRQTQAVAL